MRAATRPAMRCWPPLRSAMAGATRDGDRLYRYGGDEFAAILPGADRKAAHEVAERIRRAVAELVGDDERTAGHDQRRCRVLPRRRAHQGRAGRRCRSRAVPGEARRPRSVRTETHADPYLRALDETAIALLDRTTRQDDLLETILLRATALLGTPHGVPLPRRAGRRRPRPPPRHGLLRGPHRVPAPDRPGARRAGLSDRRSRSPSTTTTRGASGR